MDKKTLAPSYRAQMFAALQQHRGVQAGWDKIFQLLHQGQQAARVAQLPEVAGQMQEGQTIVLQALRKSGKFLDWELSVLEVGLASGTIDASYRRLCEHYTLLEKFRGELSRSIKLHLAIVFAALLVVNALFVAQRQLSVGDAAICTALAMAALAGGVGGVAVWVYRLISANGSRRVPAWARRIPLLNRVVRAGQQQHFFSSVNQVVDAGLPLPQALKIAAKKTPAPHCQAEFMQVYHHVAGGGKLSAALLQSGLLQGIYIGPMSLRGAGPREAMLHLANAVQAHYLQQLSRLAGWLPQILYGLLPIPVLVQWLAIAN